MRNADDKPLIISEPKGERNSFKLFSLIFFMEEGEMQEVVIRKVGVLSAAIFSAILGIFIGLITGIFLVIIYSVANSMFPTVNPYISDYSSWVYYSLIILPLLDLVLGFVLGGIFAFVYNISAKLFNGVKLYS